MKKIIITCLALFLLIGLFSGCTGSNDDPSYNSETVEPKDVAIVLGALTGNPRIETAPVKNELEELARTGGTLTVIVPDGDAQAQETISVAPVDGNLPSGKQEQIVSSRLSELQTLLDGSLAQEPQANYLQAIANAGRALRAGKCEQRELYILGSCLNTTEPLDLSKVLLDNIDVQGVLQRLQESKELPALEHITVTVCYLGDTDASKQQPLSALERERLQELWERLLSEAGAETITFSAALPGTETYDEDLPEVSCVPVLQPVSAICENKVSADVIVLSEESVGFKPGSAELINSEASENILHLAEYLKSNHQTGLLVGGTAGWGSQADSIALGYERAQVVKSLLCDQNVPDSALQCIGAGFLSPLQINDQSADGSLDESLAPSNRVVVFVNSASPFYNVVLSDANFSQFQVEEDMR